MQGIVEESRIIRWTKVKETTIEKKGPIMLSNLIFIKRMNRVLVDEDKAYPIPKISDISRQIMQERSRLEGSGIGETHENLYHESKVRLENKRLLELKHLEDNCSFHPEININSKIIASAINEDQSFIQRVERDCMDRRNKSSEMHGRSQMSLTEVMNPETNLPFFHPMVGRGPMQQVLFFR